MRSPERQRIVICADHGSSSASCSSSNEMKHLADHLNAAQVKLKRLHRLEMALVDFFMEVMDRSTATEERDDEDDTITSTSHEQETPFARLKRKEQFLKKAEGDPISLLNALRIQLRLQFTSQTEQQRRMGQTLATMVSRKALDERENQEAMQQQYEESAKYKQQLEIALGQVTISECEKERLTKQYKRSLELLNTELHRLREENSNKEQQLVNQQHELEIMKEANTTLRKDKKQLLDKANIHASALTPQNSSISTNGSTNCDGGDTVEIRALRRALGECEAKLLKAKATNEEANKELQRMQQQIVGYRHTTQAQNCARLEKEVKKQKVLVDELKKKFGNVDAELLRTKGALKERDNLVQQTKDEYNRLFTSLQKVKHSQVHASVKAAGIGSHSIKLKSVESMDNLLNFGGNITSHSGEIAAGSPVNDGIKGGAELRSQANENPYLLSHYRSRIEQLEKDLEGMQVQIRKMIASEYHHKQKNRLFRQERMQLMNMCDHLHSELDKSVLTCSKTITNTNKQLTATMSRDKSPPRPVDGARRLTKSSSYCALNEVKRLRRRNEFLEERFRLVLQSATTTTAQTTKKPTRSQLHANMSTVSNAKDADPLLRNDVDGDDDSTDEDWTWESSNERQIYEQRSDKIDLRTHHSSIQTLNTDSNVTQPARPRSASVVQLRHSNVVTQVPEFDNGSFRSIDPSTLISLQQVKNKARVRPQSATGLHRL